MKVYLLQEQQIWEDGTVPVTKAVFSTKEKAEEFIKKHNEKWEWCKATYYSGYHQFRENLRTADSKFLLEWYSNAKHDESKLKSYPNVREEIYAETTKKCLEYLDRYKDELHKFGMTPKDFESMYFHPTSFEVEEFDVE